MERIFTLVQSRGNATQCYHWGKLALTATTGANLHSVLTSGRHATQGELVWLLNATMSGGLTWGEIGLSAQRDNGTSWQTGMDWHGGGGTQCAMGQWDIVEYWHELVWGEMGLSAQWDNGTSWKTGMDRPAWGEMGLRHRGKLAWTGVG